MSKPLIAVLIFICTSCTLDAETKKPNVILMMADDLGYGDCGFQGNKVIKTPHLDKMAKSSLRFTRFYSAAPVCSPTRGSCMTGRHPYRYGIYSANVGHLPGEEVTFTRVLKKQGYTTGHFGKWHLGTLTKTEKDSNRGGPKGVKHYAPPWERGFDVCFSTEAKVPTWNPMENPMTGKPYGTAYWSGPGKKVTDNLKGDDSRIIMDRVVPFITQAAKEDKPFFVVIWFHTPHLPVRGGPEYLKLYPNVQGKAQHYYACVSAMDEQVGRLRKTLRDLKVADDTMLWFCSDNGPEGRKGNAPGTAGKLRGRKRDLLEGGVRVPGLLEWPSQIREARVTDVPACTSDYLPTVMDVLDVKMPDERPVDGVSLVPLLEGKMKMRPKPIAFESAKQWALVGNQYKLIRSPKLGKAGVALFDLQADPGETKDLSKQMPEMVKQMQKEINAWRASCRKSVSGADY